MNERNEMLSICNLKKTYQTSLGPLTVLNGIDLHLTNGIVAILGSNGAGKTTLIKTCTDLLEYEEGEILYNGKNLKEMCKAEKNVTFSFLSEDSRNIYYKLTPLENIKYFTTVRGVKYNSIKATCLSLLNRLNLYEKRNELVESLSRGMRQKVAIICALSMNTPVVFLDEPTLGLDIESSIELSKFLSREEFRTNRLIVISSHDLNFVNNTAQQIFKLQNGTIKSKDDLDGLDSSFRMKIMHPNIKSLENAGYEIIERHPQYCWVRVYTSSLLLGKEINKLNTAGYEVISAEAEQDNITNFYLNR